jgi:glycosyltransferase involved in cell wall biosynthesis
MSQRHKLYVIVGSCNYEFGDYSELENLKIQNVDFIFVRPNRYTSLIIKLYKIILSKFGSWTSYLIYNIWEKQVYCYVKKNIPLDEIDVIHFAAPVGFHEPGYLYKLKKPYIWGPIGGFENCKKELYSHYITQKKFIILKNILNDISILFSVRIRTVMKRADIVIACTISNKKIIEKIYNPQKLVYFTENGLIINENEILRNDALERKYAFDSKGSLNIIWCGSFVPRKMPNMLIDIIKKVKYKEKIKVLMIGAGPLTAYINQKIIENNLSCIKLLGSMKRTDVLDYFSASHLHIMTSAYEANSTVMMEAMQYCVPSIVIDHCGMADLVVHEKTGLKVQLTNYEDMCIEFAGYIDTLANSISGEGGGVLLQYAMHLRSQSFDFIPKKRIDFFDACYYEAIGNFNQSKIGSYN